MPAATALVMHPDCALHDTGWGHPEHQGRLPAIVRAREREAPALLDVMLQKEAEPADVDDLLRVHTAEHIERIRQAARVAAERDEQVLLDSDTPVSGASWDAARAAAGCAITAAALVLDREAATAFAAARPPGHHATATEAMGFCLFNNVAVAARWAQAERGVDRVLIVDWDVHHGNGTQQIFYEDPTVYYLSLHLSPHYPGTGSATERGAGAGAGTTRNVPLPAGTSATEYRQAFDAALDVSLAEWDRLRPADTGPGLVLISAGFDGLAGDPLGGLSLEPADLYDLTMRLVERTRPLADGRVVAVLEGGYAPDRTGAGVVQVIRALGGLPSED